MKRFFIIGLVLLAFSQTHCDDAFSRRNIKMNDLIEGDWKITQVTYKQSSVGKPDSVVHEVGTIRLTPNCVHMVSTSEYCTRSAYCKPNNQTEYEMRWSANYNMDKKRTFRLDVRDEQMDILQLNSDRIWDIVDITKSRFVVSCVEKEIVFTK